MISQKNKNIWEEININIDFDQNNLDIIEVVVVVIITVIIKEVVTTLLLFFVFLWSTLINSVKKDENTRESENENERKARYQVVCRDTFWLEIKTKTLALIVKCQNGTRLRKKTQLTSREFDRHPRQIK